MHVLVCIKKNKNNSKQENFPFLFLMYKIDKENYF